MLTQSYNFSKIRSIYHIQFLFTLSLLLHWSSCQKASERVQAFGQSKESWVEDTMTVVGCVSVVCSHFWVWFSYCYCVSVEMFPEIGIICLKCTEPGGSLWKNPPIWKDKHIGSQQCSDITEIFSW